MVDVKTLKGQLLYYQAGQNMPTRIGAYVQGGCEGIKVISQNQDKNLLRDNGIVLILVYMINTVDRPRKCETEVCILSVQDPERDTESRLPIAHYIEPPKQNTIHIEYPILQKPTRI